MRPNDPDWIADPNLAEGWYAWKYRCNLNMDGDSAYSIDLADLMVLVEEAPWLWCACWLDLEEMQMQQMMGEFFEMEGMQLVSEPIEMSVEQQISQLQDALVFLARLWLDDPEIHQEIDTQVWQEFMLSVYQELLDLQPQSIQLE